MVAPNWVMTERQRRERAAEIVTRRAAGETLDALGVHYGITRERVRQIVLREKTRRALPDVPDDHIWGLY